MAVGLALPSIRRNIGSSMKRSRKMRFFMSMYEELVAKEFGDTTVTFGGVIKLFDSISSLVQPSVLALPPNIWNHLLYILFFEQKWYIHWPTLKTKEIK